MSTIIEDIVARKVLNSRGDETIEVDVITVDGVGRASAPSGASRGKAEVVPFPNGSVDEAVKRVEEVIAPELIGLSADEQEEIDGLLHDLDGTDDFSEIGGNTAYAVSLAVAEAAANSYGLPLFQYLGGYVARELPYPLGNVLGGGKHALGKAPDIQEFLVLSIGAPTFAEAARANVLVHKRLGRIIKRFDANFTGGKGDEGAWAPNLTSGEALEALTEACEAISGEVGFECRVGLDVAASSLWNPEKKEYTYVRDGVKRDPGEQLEYIKELIEKYRLIYVEDPFHEEDFESFKELTRRVRGCLICGDDLFVTNSERLCRGIEMCAGNSIIIKVNQVGTLTDAWRTTETAKKARYIPVISHRSGETTAFHIAHLAVAFGCPIIKTGVMGGERAAKINELIRIEEMLGNRARMPKLTF